MAAAEQDGFAAKRWACCMKAYITASDFRLWRDSHERFRRRAPSSTAAPNRSPYNPLAELLFPDAPRIEREDPSFADQMTRTLISKVDCVVLGPCLTSGPFVARPDILIRRGSELQVIVIAPQGARLREWEDAIDDLVFDLAVVGRSCPDVESVPQMLVFPGTTRATRGKAKVAAPVSVYMLPVRDALGALLEETVTGMEAMLKEPPHCDPRSRSTGLGETP